VKNFELKTKWGACMSHDNVATFRLWAPGLEKLSLQLGQEAELRPMRDEGEGWFSLSVSNSVEGAAYAFILPDGAAVPDPAARAQIGDVHGPSRLVRPSSFPWRYPAWCGRNWEEAAIYELHVGTFSIKGDFDGVRNRLDQIAADGFTAIELMPVAQFSGSRGWGYDGVLHYCPHGSYGGVDGLKRLVDAAHERNLIVILDVVYNHFGPEGNYLASYAPHFFDADRHTPWGPAIRFEERAVRDFFVENALYWLHEYRLDGLRLDAIDQISDASESPILEEIAATVRQYQADRQIHLTTEDARNITSLHRRDPTGLPELYTAEWNDDFHHAAHCIATGENEGYYAGFADDPVGRLVRSLAEGFTYQGESYSPWSGKERGEPSADLPPTAFIAFLQNHDQTGNRALGERLPVLAKPALIELLTAIHILNPQIPLFFMGEEHGETRPFLFFTDFHGDLATAVREGRRREFAGFAGFGGERVDAIPDPNAVDTFDKSRPDWRKRDSPAGSRRLDLIRNLLRIRARHVVPLIAEMTQIRAKVDRFGQDAFAVSWHGNSGRWLRLVGNLGKSDAGLQTALFPPGNIIYASGAGNSVKLDSGRIAAETVTVVSGEPNAALA
jgi:maltooligosyltrehalose trehalohydrolase